MSSHFLESKTRLRARLADARFELLFASLMCVFLLNTLFAEDVYGGLAQACYLPFQILAGINLFNSRIKVFYRSIWAIGAALIGGRLLDLFSPLAVGDYIGIFYICFFGLVAVELFRQIFVAEVVDRKIVLAAVCGLLLVGHFGFFVFVAVEVAHPGSFAGLAPGASGLSGLFYYSFITIMTIGYGDITPVSWGAKNATVLVALLGYLYSIVIVAMLVGHVRLEHIGKQNPDDKEEG